MFIIRRARPKACRGRIYTTALRRNPYQDSPKGIPPRTGNGRPATEPLKWPPELRYCTAGTNNRFCGLPWGVFVVPVWASLLASGGIRGHLAAYLVGFWTMLCGLGFETLPKQKSNDFGTFCAENAINNLLFVHLTVLPQSPHFLRFLVSRGSHFGCLGPPFSLSGGSWGSHCCSAGVPGRLQKKACSTTLHSRYILVENCPKRGPEKKVTALILGPFGDLLGSGDLWQPPEDLLYTSKNLNLSHAPKAMNLEHMNTHDQRIWSGEGGPFLNTS